MINKKSKIYVAGHKGLIGSAILRKLKLEKYSNLLFRTKKQDNKIRYDNVVVPAKITLVKKESLSEVVPKISEFANTQNIVKKADFSSRHPFHINIKNLSNKIRTSEGQQWFYERMRGEYQMQKMKQKDLGKNKKSKILEVSPSNMKMTKEDLGKFINCS